MNLMTPEQITIAQKANLNTLFGLTKKTFESAEKFIDLSLQTVKSSFSECEDTAQKMLSAKDLQELLALQANFMQPLAENILGYGRQLCDIISVAQADCAKFAEEQYEEQQRKIQALIENLAKNAPAGSETAVAVIKSAIATANTTVETVHKATKQAVEIAQSNFNAAATAASKAAQQAATQASRAAAKKP